VAEFCSTARENGFAALICGAGKAAHLAGAAAAHSTLPVIGVPIAAGGLGGVDALYATVQMPTGIPVATVAIDSAANAAYLAAAIISVSDAGVAGKLDEYRRGLAG
jgi:5-(carboxyamino)imidazole ribonucleotide mutase